MKNEKYKWKNIQKLYYIRIIGIVNQGIIKKGQQRNNKENCKQDLGVKRPLVFIFTYFKAEISIFKLIYIVFLYLNFLL